MKRMAWLLAITATVTLGGSAAVQAQAQRRRVSPTRSHAGGSKSAPAKARAQSEPDARSAPPADAEPAATPAEDAAAAHGLGAASGSTVEDAAPHGPSADVAADAGGTSKATAATTTSKAKPEPVVKTDSAALQQELAQLMDDLVQTRERVAVIGKTLFKTKLRIKLDNRAQPDQVAGRVSLRLDGAPVFSADGSGLRDAERTLFEGFAAPGAHVLELEIEQRARADEAYRYTQRESFRFEVVEGKRTDLRLQLDDDSDIAEDFRDDQEGEYDVRTRLQVQAVNPGED